jgi:hypothetical protein
MSNPTLTPVPGAEPRYDDDGNEIVDICTCGACGRSWNDAAVSSITPAPSGRCPFEYEHTEDEDSADAHWDEPTGYCTDHGAYDPAGNCPGCVESLDD